MVDLLFITSKSDSLNCKYLCFNGLAIFQEWSIRGGQSTLCGVTEEHEIETMYRKAIDELRRT